VEREPKNIVGPVLQLAKTPQLASDCLPLESKAERMTRKNKKEVFTTHKFAALVLRHIILAVKHMERTRNRHKFDFKAP